MIRKREENTERVAAPMGQIKIFRKYLIFFSTKQKLDNWVTGSVM